MQTLLAPHNLSRITFGHVRPDGTRVDKTFFNNGAGELVEQPAPITSAMLSGIESDGSDAHDNRPPADGGLEPVLEPPALVLEPVSIIEFVTLIATANRATQALERFVQLHDPKAIDVRALCDLRSALAPFYPVPQVP